LPESAPAFAKRFARDIPATDLLEAIARPTHADSFIDAYVRWQLTSFKPNLSGLDDQQLVKLLANAPAMIMNPRADAETVATCKKIDSSSRLNDREIAALRVDAAGLDRRAAIAETLNAPAEGYRDWIASAVDSSPAPDRKARELQCLIERCAAIIKAGWPSRSVKTKLTKEFRAAGLNRAITAGQRQAIADQVRRLVGMNRTAVNDISFMAGGAVEITFTTSAVDQDDVDRWIGYLNGSDVKR